MTSELDALVATLERVRSESTTIDRLPRFGLRPETTWSNHFDSDLRAEYRAACQTSNSIIADVGDPDAPVMHNGKTRELRWAVLAVINETARHAGHADIIREQIDGKTGTSIALMGRSSAPSVAAYGGG